ncbi:MAG: tRNA (guanosine(46)-N7)-methyltransferase TrmB [Promicromonosporaceae bacterium]|nr:tRNA (guanosine(46)-N7)-methyltransferase TrmB [Promicromonosporaceae bacterium]
MTETNLEDGVGEPRRRKIVSYVRRTERLTNAQQRVWDTARERYLIDVPRGQNTLSIAPKWQLDAATTFKRQAPLIVEIGTGRGENIVAAAAESPERNFLGVEVYTPGVAQAMVRAEQCRDRTGLDNLRLIQADAVDLLTTGLPDGSVDEMWIFFSDPWHKKRHHKRRLITPEFVALAARALRPGGMLRLATDWAHYAQQIREVCEGCPALSNAHGPGEDALGAWAARFDGRVLTAFEQRGINAGRTIYDLAYLRA